MNKVDILAIGDIATNVFIKINNAETKCDSDGEHCKLCLNYGGKIPYESAEVCNAVGNSSNLAISVSRLGLKTALISYLGNDNIGKDDLAKLRKENIDTDQIKIIDGLESNYHYVLWYGAERTILVKHTEFPYSLPKELPETKWIYLSSLASNSFSYHREISEYIKNHKEISLAFQPGTFQIKIGRDELKEIYENTKIVFLNKEEAKIILDTEEEDISKLLKMISGLGPKIVIITDGVDGSYSYDGLEIFHMKAFTPNTNQIESTGAGDSFAGGVMGALCLGKTISESLMWGAANACSVVSFIGPHKGLLDKTQIEDYLKDKMNDYKPSKIN